METIDPTSIFAVSNSATGTAQVYPLLYVTNSAGAGATVVIQAGVTGYACILMGWRACGFGTVAAKGYFLIGDTVPTGVLASGMSSDSSSVTKKDIGEIVKSGYGSTPVDAGLQISAVNTDVLFTVYYLLYKV